MIRLKLKHITFEILKDTFPSNFRRSTVQKKWSYGITMPNGGDSNRVIREESDLINYKAQVFNKYGDVIMTLNPNENVLWYERAVIDCPRYKERQDRLGLGVKKALNN